MPVDPDDAPPLDPSPLDAWLNPQDGFEYVFVPPGSFEMGASPGDDLTFEDEKPRHLVVLTRGFWLCRTPVTVAAYRSFCGVWDVEMPWPPQFNPDWKHADHPMVRVTWAEAREYCSRRGLRLPTEAEWEYAARAGTSTRYWWGSEMDDACAWHAGNSGGRTRSVGGKRANPWGLYDVLGNVGEWCADRYSAKAYDRARVEDPYGPPGPGRTRVIRGGSWGAVAADLRVSIRSGNRDDRSDDAVGFRTILETETY